MSEMLTEAAGAEDLRRSLDGEDTRFIAAMERVASVVGSDFFDSAAQLLGMLLDVRFAFIAECTDPESKMARTLAFWGESGLAENFEFCAKDGPCERVIDGEILHVREDVLVRFPDNEALRSLGPESYFGCALSSALEAK